MLRRVWAIVLIVACAVLPVVVLSACGTRTSIRDYAREVDTLSTKSDSARKIAVIREWRRVNPGDPEACVAEANYWFELGTIPGFSVTTKPPSEGDLAISDSKTGSVVGSLSEADHYDSLLLRRAQAVLEDGILRWPYRLDLYFGHAYIDEKAEDFSSELQILSRAVQYAKQSPRTLRWTHGSPLDAAPDSFMASGLHEYALHQAQRQSPAGDSAFAALAIFAVGAYPSDVRLLNDMAAICDMKGQPHETLKWLMRAQAADTSDALVLQNISKVYRDLGDVSRARQYMRLAMEKTPDPQDRAEEVEELRAIK